MSGISLIETLFRLVMCHLVGDYVLQIDFIAKTKGENWYHLLVHCLLYCLPFYLAFGFVWQIFVLLAIHIVVDAMKARYKKINYITDQVIHYVTLLIFWCDVKKGEFD